MDDVLMGDEVPGGLTLRDIAIQADIDNLDTNIYIQIQHLAQRVVQILAIDLCSKDYKVLRDFFMTLNGTQTHMSGKVECSEVEQLIQSVENICIDTQDTLLPSETQTVGVTLQEIRKKIRHIGRLLSVQWKILEKVAQSQHLGDILTVMGSLSAVHPTSKNIIQVCEITTQKFGFAGLKKVMTTLLESEYLRDFWAQPRVILYFLMKLKLISKDDKIWQRELIIYFLSYPIVVSVLVENANTLFIKKIKSDIGRVLFEEIFGQEISKNIG